MELEVNLKQLLKNRDMTQKELAEKTGLTEAQISAIAANRTSTVNKVHIGKIANALNEKDLNEIFYWKNAEK